MNTSVKIFRALHQHQEPLLIGNVWNVQSAKVQEKLKYKAIGTSSAAVAEALGYRDGENMSFEEYFFIVKRIKASVTIPFTVDMEAGYGSDAIEIAENIKRLADLGVAGINIEDSMVRNSVREILTVESFEKKLSAIKGQLSKQHIDIFVNVRCDAFLLNLPDAAKEAVRRITVYERAGADGIFLPCITATDDIKTAVNATRLPVNVMCMPALPDFGVLQSLGVKRISMGNFMNTAVYKYMEMISHDIVKERSFAGLFR